MKKRKGVAIPGWAIGVIAVIAALFVVQSGFLGSTVGGGGGGGGDGGCLFAAPGVVAAENCGTSADTSVRVFDAVENTKTQVAADVKAWEITPGAEGEQNDQVYLGTTTSSASSATTISSTYGAKVKYAAFNGTYDYTDVKEVTVTRDGQNVELTSYQGATTSDLTATIRNDETGSSTTSDTLAGDQQEDYTLELELSSSNLAYNPAAVCFRHSDTTDDNITSVTVNNAESVPVPADISNYDSCYQFGQGMNSQKPTQFEFDTVEAKMVVQADSDGTGANDQIDIAYKDYAPYVDGANNLAFGMINHLDADVGVADVTDTMDYS